MRQVLLRAIHLLRRPAVWVAALAVSGGGSALVMLPLFGLPGYELSLAVCAAIGLLGGVMGGAAAFQERRIIQGRDPRPSGAVRTDSAAMAAWFAFGAAAVLNVVVAVPPFVAAVLYAVTSSRCNPFAQSAFYPALVVPSALLSAAVGSYCGLRSGGRWGATLRYAGLVVVSGALTGWPIYFGPQVFAYNHFAGYLPGPLYDEAIALRAPLLWFRFETLLVVGFFLSVTALCLDMREGRVGWPRLRLGAFLLTALTGSGIALIERRAPLLGIRTPPEYLEERLGSSRDSEHFHLVHPRGKSREEVDRWVRDLEFRYVQVSEFLGGGPSGRIQVYLYRSAEEKDALVGASQTQFTKPWRLEVHLNDSAFPSAALKHELVHAMAAKYASGPFRVPAWAGVLPNMGLAEGLAVAGEDPVNELTLHQSAAALRRQKLAPDLLQLFRLERFYATAAARAYAYAGSFIRYLAETYGTQKLQELYAHGDFERAYGRSLPSLATEWEGFLDQIPLDEAAANQAFARFRQGSIFARSCAREVVSLAAQAQEELRGDPDHALTLFQRCAQLQQEEPSFQMSVASALEELDRKGEALQVLDALEARVKEQPALRSEVLMAKADLEVKMDRKPEAVTALQDLLTLNPTAATDRTARVKLAALAEPEVGAALWSYLRPGHEEVKLLVLRDALARSPEHPIVLYLLGRRLEQGGAPARAAGYLTRSLAGELPPSIRREALRLKLEADYLTGDCDAVRDAVGQLPDLGAAMSAQAREWVQRCDFELRAFKGPLVPKDGFR